MKKIILVLFLTILVTVPLFTLAIKNKFYQEGSHHQVTVNVANGWNLIQGFHPDYISAESQIGKNDVKIIFAYSPDLNKYIELYPNLRIQDSGVNKTDEYYGKYLNLRAHWVYSTKAGKLTYKINHPVGEDTFMANFILKKGWNFVGINPEMFTGDYNTYQSYEGQYFSWDSIKGSCAYEKIYIWNWETQKWLAMDSNLKASASDFSEFLGSGMLVKVTTDCKLVGPKKTSTINPPGIPN